MIEREATHCGDCPMSYEGTTCTLDEVARGRCGDAEWWAALSEERHPTSCPLLSGAALVRLKGRCRDCGAPEPCHCQNDE